MDEKKPTDAPETTSAPSLSPKDLPFDVHQGCVQFAPYEVVGGIGGVRVVGRVEDVLAAERRLGHPKPVRRAFLIGTLVGVVVAYAAAVALARYQDAIAGE